MRVESPFHEGERAVQETAGEAAQGARSGGVIADSIIPGALPFIEKQRMVIVGSVDPAGDVWASIILGESGFIRTADSRTIELDPARVHQNPHDPLWANIEQDPRAGLLLIELATRRRLRVNGRFERIDRERLRLHVEEAYPNCPKYIQRRHLIAVTPAPGEAGTVPRTGGGLDAALEGLIGAADTLFVASVASSGGVDVSHRGGNPGFVRIVDERTLRIPDYPGNSMFNTLGNFAANPQAGLLFLDFEQSRVVQLIGRPEIRWDLDEAPEETGGTGRSWDFEVHRWLETMLPFQVEWEFLDYSPFNPGQGVTGVRAETSVEERR